MTAFMETKCKCKWWQNFSFIKVNYPFKWLLQMLPFPHQCVFKVWMCERVQQKRHRGSQRIWLLLTIAFPLIKSTFNHLWPIFPRVALQAVMSPPLPLLELSSWALSDGLSHLSPVHQNSAETLEFEARTQCSAVPRNFLQHTAPHEPRPGGKFPVYFQKKRLSLPQLWIILIYSCTVR